MALAATSNIAELPPEDFQSIVNKDVRGELDHSTSIQLREAINVTQWYDCLLKLKRSVEAQLTSNRAELTAKQAELLDKGQEGLREWLEAKAAAERWRQGAIRFKNGVEERLLEAKRIRHQINDESFTFSLVKDRDKAVLESARLREAILSHKEAVLSDVADDSVDDNLWAALGTQVI